MARCPGQDMRYWTPEDIFDVKCPFCGEEIEFWKDEPARLCRDCGNEVRNPRINLGCAKWCKSAKECLGEIPEEHIAAAPIIETLRAKLKQAFAAAPERLDAAEAIHAFADTLLAATGGDPCVIKAGALLSAVEDQTLRDQLITDIGIEEQRSQLLTECLTTISEDGALETPEAQVISDALKIARAAGADTPPDVEQLVARLATESARHLARRRFSATSRPGQ